MIYIYIYMCVHLYVYDTCIWECWFLYVCITLPKQPKITCCYCAFYFCKCFYCLTVFLLSVCKVMSPVKDKFLLPLGQTINYLSIFLSIAKNAHVNRCNPVYFPMYTGFLYVHRASFCVPAVTCILEK